MKPTVTDDQAGPLVRGCAGRIICGFESRPLLINETSVSGSDGPGLSTLVGLFQEGSASTIHEGGMA